MLISFNVASSQYGYSFWARINVFPSLPPVACQCCNSMFNNWQSCSVHMWKVHNHSHVIKQYGHATHCAVCMVEFHSRPRIINHLLYRSHICRYNLLLGPPLISPCALKQLELDAAQCVRAARAAGLHRHKAVLPAFRLQGPLINVIPIDSDKHSKHHVFGIGRQYYNCNYS